MYKTKFLLSAFVFLISFHFSFSQNSVIQKTDSAGYYKLNDVVVTATKTPTSTIEIANSISVIDSEQISNSNANNVFDILKNEIGISNTRLGGNGTLSNINIRGANNSHTLVLIDGVEVNLTNDPGGVYDFSALPIDNIERIEILRGPQSTLYGSDALAGVINIISKKGIGSPRFSLLTEAGSYNTYKGTLGINGSIEKLNYSATFSRSQSDGFSAASEKYGNTEKDGYTFNNLSALLGYHLSDNAELNLYTRFLKSESDNDQFGGMFGDDPTYLTKQEEFSIRGEGKFKLFDGVWNQKIGLSFIRNVRKNSYDTTDISVYYSNALYDGRKYKFDWQNDFQLGKFNLLTAGLDFEKEESSSEYFSFKSPDTLTFSSIQPFNFSNSFGIYLQDQLKLEESFFLSLGLRLDNHNHFGSKLTYRISPAYMLWESGTKFKMNIGTGFKSPSLYYMYELYFGNKDLKPEKSFGIDAGIEQYLFDLNTTAGATVFYNRFEDLIVVDYSQFKSININRAVTKGAEFYLQAKPFDNFEIKLNYTFTESKDVSKSSENPGEKLLRRPENKSGFYISYSFIPEANINTEVIWVGTREDMDFSLYPYKRVELDDYFLLNVSAHFDLFKFLRLNIRVENLLDEKYEDALGYGTAGLSFYGGIKLSL
jgi:vitamin B12 transporter